MPTDGEGKDGRLDSGRKNVALNCLCVATSLILTPQCSSSLYFFQHIPPIFFLPFLPAFPFYSCQSPSLLPSPYAQLIVSGMVRYNRKWKTRLESSFHVYTNLQVVHECLYDVVIPTVASTFPHISMLKKVCDRINPKAWVLVVSGLFQTHLLYAVKVLIMTLQTQYFNLIWTEVSLYYCAWYCLFAFDLCTCY